MRVSHFKLQRGFSFIEVLVALGLIGVTVVLSAALTNSVPLARFAGYQDIALTIAENRLEQLRGEGYAALPPTGAFSDALLLGLPSGGGAVAVTSVNATTKRVEVTVYWKEPALAASSSISLTTLITESGGL